MSKAVNSSDKIAIRQKRGVWLRFVKLFPKCRLPWFWLAAYIILDLGLVNIGLNETEYTAALFSGDTSTRNLMLLIGTIVINLIGANLLIFTRMVTSARTDRNMRSVLYDKVTRLPMSYFKDENPREVTYRVVANATVISSTVLYAIFPLVTAAYTSVATIGRVFTYDWRLSAILIGFIPVQVFIAFIFGRINYSLNDREKNVNAGLMQRLAELVTNIPLAKAFAKEQKETERGEEMTARLYKLNIKGSWLGQLQELSTTFVSLAQALMMVLVGAFLLRNGEIATRAWVTFFLFSSIFSGAVDEFMMYWNNIKIIQGGAERLAEIMDAPEENRKGDKCENLHGDIVLNDVDFGYEAETPVLKGVSCTFRDNCVTALLGPSGCGKTTLVNLILRLYDVSSGSVSVEGKEIGTYALDDYRAQFVMVSQNSMLFSGTIRENICYGNGSVTDEALTEAMKRAGAYDFVSKLPEGVDTVLEEYGNNLSGGQRQRLSVARALLSDAHYIILDEPAASMDAVATSELMEILKNIRGDRAMIIIAHTAAILPIAERAVVIGDGTVEAEGEISELIKTNGFLRDFAGEGATL